MRSDADRLLGDRDEGHGQGRLIPRHPAEPRRKSGRNRLKLRCTNLCVPLGTRTRVVRPGQALGGAVVAEERIAEGRAGNCSVAARPGMPHSQPTEIEPAIGTQ
jgi:hypothetical protein